MAVQTESRPTPAAPGVMRCPRDGDGTRLTCVQCGTPICPSCLMRTPVGLKCPTCVSPPAPTRRRRRPLLALVALLAAVAVAAAVVLGDGPNDGPEEIAEMAVSSGGPATAVIGQETTVGAFTVTVTGVECTAGPLGTAPVIRTPEGRFCVASLQIRNDGLAPRSFPAPFQRITDGTRRFGPDTVTTRSRPALVLASGARELTPIPLNPGLTVEGVLVFDLPPDVEPTALELRAGPRGRAVQVALPA